MNTVIPTQTARYTPIAMALHWLLALMIVGAFCVGLYMHELPLSPTRLKLYNWHKWAGISILALSADAPMPAWQRMAAHGAHWALYALFFLVPLAGWAYSSAAGFPIVVFGLLPLPDFVAPDRALAEVLKERHAQLAWALCIVVLLHIAAALKHHFIDRDGLLNRMRPA